MTIKDIQTFLQPQMLQVEALIGASLQSDIALLDATNRKLREHPGKMLRPLLSLLVAGACGTPGPDSIRFAAAAELLHNSTLLHDDVVDGATERRGVPTVAQYLSVPSAVLIGDFWLTRCMQVILDAEKYSERVLRVFSATLGHLAEGELLQMQKASDASTTQQDYLRIVYCKTASLFESAAVSAAISVGAPEPVVQAMGQFANCLGIAFQIKDDIFDYAPASKDLGKPVGIDLLEQKITQPLLCAMEMAPAAAPRIRSLVSKMADNPAGAAEVRSYVAAYQGVENAATVMDLFIAQAIGNLSVLPPSREKDALEVLARYVADRSV